MSFAIPSNTSSYEQGPPTGSSRSPMTEIQRQHQQHQIPQDQQNTESIDALSQPSSPSSLYSASTNGTGNGTDGDRTFPCPHCQHVFSRKHNLKSHLLIHSQDKPFNCSICSSKFRRLHDLKRHEKLHTGEKPHKCKNCGRKFARLDALVRHNNSQTGCNLLIDNVVIKGNTMEGTSTFVTERRNSSSSSATGGVDDRSTNSVSVTPTNLPSQRSTILTKDDSPNTQTNHPPLQQPRIHETAWRVNQQLPSISRLPLEPLPPQPLPPATTSQQLGQSISLDSLTAENTTNYELLPYVKLLESRVSLLESKLSSAETKLAQLSYNYHQWEFQRSQQQQNGPS